MNRESLENKYYGKSYVWVNPQDSDIKAGDKARCIGVRNIESLGGWCLEFAAGTPVPISKISMYLKEEGYDYGESVIDIVSPGNNYKKPGEKSTKKPVHQDTGINSGIDVVEIVEEPPVRTAKNTATAAPKKNVDMFSGFKKESRNIELSVNVELPNDQLIRMMYENSDNKEEFIANYADYINSHISRDTIIECLTRHFSETE